MGLSTPAPFVSVTSDAASASPKRFRRGPSPYHRSHRCVPGGAFIASSASASDRGLPFSVPRDPTTTPAFVLLFVFIVLLSPVLSGPFPVPTLASIFVRSVPVPVPVSFVPAAFDEDAMRTRSSRGSGKMGSNAPQPVPAHATANADINDAALSPSSARPGVSGPREVDVSAEGATATSDIVPGERGCNA